MSTRKFENKSVTMSMFCYRRKVNNWSCRSVTLIDDYMFTQIMSRVQKPKMSLLQNIPNFYFKILVELFLL